MHIEFQSAEILEARAREKRAIERQRLQDELSDGYVFVCANDTLSSTIDERRFDQYNCSTVGPDSDCELIDEINDLVTTS